MANRPPTTPRVRLDENGFPLPTDEAYAGSADKQPIVCPNCLDSSGAAAVSLTKKYGLATVFCHACRTRSYANSPQSHDLFRRWQLVLADPGLRAALIGRLTSVP